MIRSLIAPTLAGLLLLGACATATPYQRADDGTRGYADQQIETDRWRVSFSGNSLTDRETVETYLLYRAAELTDQQGFDWFRVVERDTDADSRLVATGFSHSPFYHGAHFRYRFYGRHGYYLRHPAFYRGGFYDPWGYGFGPREYREIVRYEASAEIKLGSGDTPDEDPSYFNADDVLVNLSGRIVRPDA